MRRILSLSLAVVILAVLVLTGTVYSLGVRSKGVTPAPGVAAESTSQETPEGQASGCDDAIISEEDAHRAVWRLPEVMQLADQLRAKGIRPFTMTDSAPGDGTAQYTIYFGEDHGTHTVRIATYMVDARTGQVRAGPDSG